MSNEMQDLNDEMVKLVAYSIVSLRRGEERILKGGEGSVIIIGRMTREAFTAYIIGRYLQQEDTNDKEDAIRELIDALDRYLRKGGERTTSSFVETLKSYLQEAISDGQKSKKKKFRKISEEDRKYLRVHYVCTNRWPREHKKFEEEQVAVLDEISQAIAS